MAHQARILTRLANQIDATEECATEGTLEVPFRTAGDVSAAFSGIPFPAEVTITAVLAEDYTRQELRPTLIFLWLFNVRGAIFVP
jgi:hypothetical protein